MGVKLEARSSGAKTMVLLAEEPLGLRTSVCVGGG